MIKIDYEGAWKELKKQLNISSTITRDAIFTTSLIDMMSNFEQKHTQSNISSELEQLNCLLTNCDFTPSIAGALRLIYGILKKNKGG